MVAAPSSGARDPISLRGDAGVDLEERCWPGITSSMASRLGGGALAPKHAVSAVRGFQEPKELSK